VIRTAEHGMPGSTSPTTPNPTPPLRAPLRGPTATPAIAWTGNAQN